MENIIVRFESVADNIIVQNYMFGCGYTWLVANNKETKHTNMDSFKLYPDDKKISCPPYINKAIEIGMEEFNKLIEQEWDGTFIPDFLLSPSKPLLHPKLVEIRDSFGVPIQITKKGINSERKIYVGNQGIFPRNLNHIADNIITAYIDGITMNKGNVKLNQSELRSVAHWVDAIDEKLLPITWDV